MKATRTLSLRREALGRLDAEALSSVGGGYVPPTLQYGANGVVSCLLSTPTWCGYVCNLTDDCKNG